MTSAWTRTTRLAGITLASILFACGGGSSSPPPVAPSVPTGVAAIGSLGSIHISWTASSGGVTGYNVHRSADGTTFTKRNDAPVSTTSYDDTLASPDDDGVMYQYRVTAVGSPESEPSSTVSCMHGTRIAGTYASSVTTEVASSPYVLDGNLTIDAGNLTVATGTKLYVLDGAVVDIAAGAAGDSANGRFVVNGLLRVLASETAHATFTSHKTGGLAAGEGFTLYFDGAPDYVTADDSGTLVRNTEVANLRSGGAPLRFIDSAPRFDNSKLLVNGPTEATWVAVNTPVIFTHCTMTGWYLTIQGDLHATDFKIEGSILQSGLYNYILDFFSVSDPLIAGQISNNDIETGTIDLAYVGGSDIPLTGNYWRTGAPSYRRQGTTPLTLSCTLAPTLSDPPAGVGPSW